MSCCFRKDILSLDQTKDFTTGSYCILAQNVQLQNGAAASLSSDSSNSLPLPAAVEWRVGSFVADKERFSTMGKRGAFAGIARKEGIGRLRHDRRLVS